VLLGTSSSALGAKFTIYNNRLVRLNLGLGLVVLTPPLLSIMGLVILTSLRSLVLGLVVLTPLWRWGSRLVHLTVRLLRRGRALLEPKRIRISAPGLTPKVRMISPPWIVSFVVRVILRSILVSHVIDLLMA
jgi:hypothetical protein